MLPPLEMLAIRSASVPYPVRATRVFLNQWPSGAANIVQNGKPPAAIQKVTMLIALSILGLVGPLPSLRRGASIKKFENI